MRRLAVFGLLTLAGCDNSPPPIAAARPVQNLAVTATFALPSDPPPAATDPAAKATVEAAIKAHTGDQPAKLAGLRTARKTVAGTLTGPNGPVANEWQFQWRWPDKWRTTAVVAGQPPLVIRRVGGSAWMSAPGVPEQPIGGGDLAGVKAETFAEGLLLLLPLADPAAVFAPAAALTVRGKPAIGVRVSGPDWPTAVCHFDAESKKLVQISYAGSEGGNPVTKEVVVLGEKEWAGVTLPERLAIRWNGAEKGDWTLKELVAPAAAADAVFDKP